MNAAHSLDPAYKDVEVCACSTPGWTHHTGFHDFVRDRQQRAWDEGFEACTEWIERCGRPADIGPPDPPLNPYGEAHR